MSNEQAAGLSRDQVTIRSTQAARDLATVQAHIRERKRAAGLGDDAPGPTEAVRRALAFMAEAIRAGRVSENSNERRGG